MDTLATSGVVSTFRKVKVNSERNITPATILYRTLSGLRKDRFTTLAPVYSTWLIEKGFGSIFLPSLYSKLLFQLDGPYSDAPKNR